MLIVIFNRIIIYTELKLRSWEKQVYGIKCERCDSMEATKIMCAERDPVEFNVKIYTICEKCNKKRLKVQTKLNKIYRLKPYKV